MSNFGSLDMPTPSERPQARDAQVRDLLANDPGAALLPELPPVPEGEWYHREFTSRCGYVLFDMDRQTLHVTVLGGGAAEAEQALLVALAMVRAGAAMGPQFDRRPAEVRGQETFPEPPRDLPVTPA